MASVGRSIARTIAAALLAGLSALTPAGAQNPLPALGLNRGALLFHGNYCGPGNRAPLPPVDALDRACMHHDACSPDAGSGGLPTCGCNRRLRAEALALARSPRQPDELRATARSVADGATLLPCR